MNVMLKWTSIPSKQLHATETGYKRRPDGPLGLYAGLIDTCINRQRVNPKVCSIFYLLGSVSSQDSIGNLPPSDYTPPGSLSSHTSIPRAGSEEFPSPPSDMFFQHRHSSGSFPPVTPPPDLTRQAPADKFTDTKGSRVMHMSSVRTIDEDDGQVSGEISLYMF